MADTEGLGVAGVEWLDALAEEADGCSRVWIPTIANPRGTDFAKADMLPGDWAAGARLPTTVAAAMAERPARARRALTWRHWGLVRRG